MRNNQPVSIFNQMKVDSIPEEELYARDRLTSRQCRANIFMK